MHDFLYLFPILFIVLYLQRLAREQGLFEDYNQKQIDYVYSFCFYILAASVLYVVESVRN